jgi:hypothetical protein
MHTDYTQGLAVATGAKKRGGQILAASCDKKSKQVRSLFECDADE